MSNREFAIIATAAIILGTSSPASASEMVYHPVSPTFGGNPLNGSFLLSTAQAQGEGVKSGQQGPDLSGLNNALSNLGSAVIVGGGSNNNGGSGGAGNSGTVP
jgi:curli production assembly/transport component CsgF